MPVTMLDGLGCGQDMGCACQKNGFNLGEVKDYDLITIGGKTYSANQIIGKTVTAARETKVYSNAKGTRVVGTVKAGQVIGKVSSYILASSPNSDGRSWLMFDDGVNFTFVPNEAVSGSALKDQGTKTVAEEVKEEEEKKAREDDPWGYYIKKYGLPALLIIGAVIIANGVAKESVKAVIQKKL